MSETSKPVAFVPWQPNVSESSNKPTTRKYHKKSRTGCQQCKSRRVKCNEEHPTCGHCRQHGATCVYGNTRESLSPKSCGSSPSNISDHIENPPLRSTLTLNPARKLEIAESKERRLLELQLLHHYMTVTAQSFGNAPSSRLSEWISLVPPLAFKHESLLQAIYAVTSLHLSYTDPDDPEHSKRYQRYLGNCLRGHRDAVAALNANNADAAMITATLLRIISCATLQLRHQYEDGMYVPPSSWLTMNHGTGHGLAVSSWKYLMHDENSIVRRWISRDAPMLDPTNPNLRDDEAVFASSNLNLALERVLERTAEDEFEEPWDDVIEKAYHTTAAYIGTCYQGIERGEPDHVILRRLVLFPAIIEREFISLVEERRGRALVLLAHHFEPWKRYGQLWWCNEVGSRELNAISQAVPPRWKPLLP